MVLVGSRFNAVTLQGRTCPLKFRDLTKGLASLSRGVTYSCLTAPGMYALWITAD